jgi:glycosyltransferase involved in cell wall biosynthesis
MLVAGSGDYTGACKMAHFYGRAFRNAGWEVRFIVGDPPAGAADRLADFLIKDGFVVREELGFCNLRDPSLIGRVRSQISEFSPTFVLSTVQIDLKIVGPACRALRIPYLIFDQTLHLFYGPTPLRWLKKFVFAREMRQALAVIAVGPAVREQALREFGCRPELVQVVPNGIITSDYQSDQAVRRFDSKPKLRALNVGRIDAQKGQRILAQALGLVRDGGGDLQLDLVGGVTPNHAASEQYHQELLADLTQLDLNERLHFLGWRSDVKNLLGGGEYHFYVHSALWEGPPLPLSILEAMASGLPVILTDCVGRPEGFVDDLHGRIVKAGDPQQLAEAITWMCCLSADERRGIGESCRRLAVERYDVAVTGKRFVELCEQALVKKP